MAAFMVIGLSIGRPDRFVKKFLKIFAIFPVYPIDRYSENP